LKGPISISSIKSFLNSKEILNGSKKSYLVTLSIKAVGMWKAALFRLFKTAARASRFLSDI